MSPTRNRGNPDLLVVDADVFFADVFNRDRDARGLIEALAEACFSFATCAKLRSEYEQFDGHMPLNQLVTLVRARLYAKSVRAREPLPVLPDVALGTWDRKGDDHLLQLAVAKAAGRIVTRERRNLSAAERVRKAFGVDVIGSLEARTLSNRPCPKLEPRRRR